jgi:hypothetical protein
MLRQQRACAAWLVSGLRDSLTRCSFRRCLIKPQVYRTLGGRNAAISLLCGTGLAAMPARLVLVRNAGVPDLCHTIAYGYLFIQDVWRKLPLLSGSPVVCSIGSFRRASSCHWHHLFIALESIALEMCMIRLRIYLLKYG